MFPFQKHHITQTMCPYPENKSSLQKKPEIENHWIFCHLKVRLSVEIELKLKFLLIYIFNDRMKQDCPLSAAQKLFVELWSFPAIKYEDDFAESGGGDEFQREFKLAW